MIAAAIIGAVVGDNIGFGIGWYGGYPLLRRFGRYIRLDEAKLKVGRYIFMRHGAKVVFFGRFVSVLRTYAAFLAGTNRMHWTRFLVANALGRHRVGDALRRGRVSGKWGDRDAEHAGRDRARGARRRGDRGRRASSCA